MKKKLLSVLMTVALAAVLVTGCGGSKEEAPQAASEETEEVAVEEEATEEAMGDVVSDETFATLQDNYVTLVDAYDAVAEFYNQDEVEADANIEATMEKAADVMSQMGEITQESITEEDAETLNSAMLDILEGLQLIVDSMS